MKFTFDFFYWYNGCNDKDIERETITASSYKKAVSLLSDKYGKILITKSIMKPCK